MGQSPWWEVRRAKPSDFSDVLPVLDKGQALKIITFYWIIV